MEETADNTLSENLNECYSSRQRLAGAEVQVLLDLAHQAMTLDDALWCRTSECIVVRLEP
jgi:hypothetical protein